MIGRASCGGTGDGAAPGSAMKPCRHPGISGSRRPSLGLLLPGRVPQLQFLGRWFGLHPGHMLLWVPTPTFPPPCPKSVLAWRPPGPLVPAPEALWLRQGPKQDTTSVQRSGMDWAVPRFEDWWVAPWEPRPHTASRKMPSGRSLHWAFSAPSSLSILCLLGLGVGGKTRWEVGGTCAKWDPPGTSCECLGKHDRGPRGASGWASRLWAQGLSPPLRGPAQMSPRSQGSPPPRDLLYLQLLSFLAPPAKTIPS